MLSLAVSELPEGQEWAYEVKFNGYRAQGVKTAGRVQLRSRYGANVNERFPSIARALEALPDETVIDGEIVACRWPSVIPRPAKPTQRKAAPPFLRVRPHVLSRHGRDA